MIVFLCKYYLQGTQYIFKYIILVANVFNYFRKNVPSHEQVLSCLGWVCFPASIGA